MTKLVSKEDTSRMLDEISQSDVIDLINTVQVMWDEWYPIVEYVAKQPCTGKDYLIVGYKGNCNCTSHKSRRYIQQIKEDNKR